MEARASAVLLWSRASLLGAVVLGSGTVAHLSASGRVPGPAFFVIVALVTVAMCAAALAGPASVGRVVVLTVAGQTWI